MRLHGPSLFLFRAEAHRSNVTFQGTAFLCLHMLLHSRSEDITKDIT